MGEGDKREVGEAGTVVDEALEYGDDSFACDSGRRLDLKRSRERRKK